MYASLRRIAHAQRVVFISDVPAMKDPAFQCVSHNMSDVPACTTARSQAIRLPQIKAAELALARQEHINTIDPTSWFCTPTRCPVIVGNIILYHDRGHMTPPWASFLAPVLSDALTPIMRECPTNCAGVNEGDVHAFNNLRAQA